MTLHLVKPDPVNLCDRLAAETAQREVLIHLRRLNRQEKWERVGWNFCKLVMVALFAVVVVLCVTRGWQW